MNDEIKEILDRIETASEIFDCLLKPEECTELLDYITNLQQENTELKMETEKLTRLWLDSQEKRRKAIEYIKHLNPKGVMLDSENWYLSNKDLLNILQNRSDSH